MINKTIDGEMDISQPVKRFNSSLLDKLVEYHLKQEVPKYLKFQKLYEGKYKIVNRKQKDQNRPNNKMINDYFEQLIDNTLSYFLGKPIIMNYTEHKAKKPELKAAEADVSMDISNMEDSVVQDTINEICIENDKDDLFMEWGKEAMIKGLSHILIYQNEESKTKLMRLSPDDVILVYKNSTTKEVEYAIRLYVIDTENINGITRYAEVYSADKIEVFSQTEITTGNGVRGKNITDFTFIEEKPHIYGIIPIVTFYNNEEAISDLEKIESLVNEYDKVLSDVSNEFEVDDKLNSNLSGVAIRFMLFWLENKCIIKERKLEKAIRNLFRVLQVPIKINTDKDFNIVDLKIEFTRNVPNNITELVNVVTVSSFIYIFV